MSKQFPAGMIYPYSIMLRATFNAPSNTVGASSGLESRMLHHHHPHPHPAPPIHCPKVVDHALGAHRNTGSASPVHLYGPSTVFTAQYFEQYERTVQRVVDELGTAELTYTLYLSVFLAHY